MIITMMKVKDNVAVRCWRVFQGFLRKIINNKIYCIINVIIIALNIVAMSDGKQGNDDPPSNIFEEFLHSDNAFTVFFIIESFISVMANGMRKSIKTFWGLLDLFILVTSIATFCGLTNLSPFRLLIILKYLSNIPLFSDIGMILKALAKSMSILRDIAVFAIFIFVCAGITGVSFWGGRFRYRCMNNEGELYDEDLVCSINPDSGYQCPNGFNCTNVDSNPANGTMGFDNIIQAWLTIFQILTTEGWSGIMINGINSTSGWSIIYFLIIIMLGNWLLLQLIVATVTSNLEKSIESNDEENQDKKITDNIINNNDNDNDNENITMTNISDIDSEKSIVMNNPNINNNSIIPTTVTVQNIPNDIVIKAESIKSNKSGKSDKSKKKEVSAFRSILMSIFMDIKFDYLILLITTIDVIALCSNHKDASPGFVSITQTISLICTIIFGIEMIIKLYAFGLRDYVKSYFNVFDGAITIASFIEIFMPHNQGMLVLRVIRAMRIFRISKFSKSLIDLAVIIRDSSKQLLSLAVIWIVSVIIFSTIGIQIFKGEMNFDEEDGGTPRANFDTMRNAILTVIQLYTVENWNDIEVSVARTSHRAYIIVLIIIIIIGAFILSQILVAILLSAFTEKIKQDMEDLKKQYTGIQARFAIKRAFNDLFENVKEKNTSLYSNSIDGGERLSHGIKLLKRKKHSSVNEDEKQEQEKKKGMDEVEVLKKNNSEPSLVKLGKRFDGNLHKALLSNQRSTSHTDFSKRSKTVTPIRTNFSNNNSSDVNDSGNESVASSNTKYTKSNDEESMDSNHVHRKKLFKYFTEYDTFSLKSFNLSFVNGLTPPITPASSEPSNVDDNVVEKDSFFRRKYNAYRQSKFVKIFKRISKNKLYLFCIYFFITCSCICLIYDRPNQTNQRLLTILRYCDIIFSIIFCIELVINIIAKGAFIEKKAYLRSVVNWIDVMVIAISIMSAFRIAESVHAFRVLRVFRLFRLVKLHEGMRIVFIAIWKTIPSLATALIPYLFFLIITSAMGLSMFVGEGWQCNDDTVKTRMECTGTFAVSNSTMTMKENRLWEKYELGYDNILDSIQTSLVITNQEGWPDIMYRYIDSAGIDQQPIRDNRPGTSAFYILSVLIGNWIFLAVVTGITFDNMKRNQDILKGLHHLTEGQRKLLDYISLVISHKPKPPPGVKQRSKRQQKLYTFFKGKTYEYIAFVVVSINIIIMILTRYNSTNIEEKIHQFSEYIFTAIYIIEVILLMYAYKVKYFFYDYWNILNLIISIFAIISIAFEIFSQPTFLTVLRLIRIIRLVKFAKGLRALASAIIFNFYQLMNVTLLMFITCCIFAIIGMHTFGDIDYNKAHALNEHLNFSTFPKSLLTVFVFSTGENWPVAMTDCSGRNLSGCNPEVENCGVFWAPVYFILLEVIFNWILLNSFSAITVDTFLNVLYDLDEINRIEAIIANFRQVWLKYDMKGKGVVEFKEMLRIYREFHIPSNFQWGPRDIGKPIKPSIQKLFKTVVVYNNRCTYADALMSILNSWVGEELPDDIKLKYWRKKNWDRVYRASRNTPMNNSLVMPSKEYSRYKRRHEMEEKLKQRKASKNKTSKSEPILATVNTNSDSVNDKSIFSKTQYSSSRTDLNYHVRPNLRKYGFSRTKTTIDNKCQTKSKVCDIESDISSVPLNNLEEAINDIPKYAGPLSTSLSQTNSSSLLTTPNSSIILDDDINSKVIDKGKSREPDSFIDVNSNDDININDKNNNNNINNKSKEELYSSNNIQQKSVIRIDSTESTTSTVPHVDITYEINKRISMLFKNKTKNRNKNKNNLIIGNNEVSSEPKSVEFSDHHPSTVSFQESPHHIGSGIHKIKKYTRVPSSLRNILRPDEEEEPEDDTDFNVNKDVLQFYVVYAIYRIQVKYRKTQKTKDDNVEVVVK